MPLAMAGSGNTGQPLEWTKMRMNSGCCVTPGRRPSARCQMPTLCRPWHPRYQMLEAHTYELALPPWKHDCVHLMQGVADVHMQVRNSVPDFKASSSFLQARGVAKISNNNNACVPYHAPSP